MKLMVVGIGLLAACQDPTMTSTTDQALLGDVCSVQGPQAIPWPGSLPPSSSTTTFVLSQYGNTWRAYAVDPAQHKIHWILSLNSKTVGSYTMATLASNRNQVSIRNPPPPRCPPNPICGDDWYAFAVVQRMELALGDAEADVDACFGE